MVLNFTEIPQANLGGGLQGTFELFTRDFLEDIGFEILQNPDRGPYPGVCNFLQTNNLKQTCYIS